MATKEDILEQIVEEYLLHAGYFVRHNVKFLPNPTHKDFESKSDSNHSDIDVIGYHPNKSGPEKVMVVSCKSWQSGFNPAVELNNIQLGKVVRGREAWKAFRELVKPKWSEALRAKIFEETGETEFTYVTAVTKLTGDKNPWVLNQEFIAALGGNPLQIIDLSEMLGSISSSLSTSLAGTEVGRMLQLFKAAGIPLR